MTEDQLLSGLKDTIDELNTMDEYKTTMTSSSSLHRTRLELVTKGLPEALHAAEHCCFQHVPRTEEKALMNALLALMKHINAPNKTMCCPFHSTALHLLATLRTIFLNPCNPLWLPLSETVCETCGMLCDVESLCGSCVMINDYQHQRRSDGQRIHAQHRSVKQSYLSNQFINLMRHIGPMDMQESVRHLRHALEATRVQPEWSSFWETTTPCQDWFCQTCRAWNDICDEVCFVCQEFPELSLSEWSDETISETSTSG